ncbi:hypothetical protein LR48_Vigan462s001400 [Vigna angularis]|uniref:Uncharacterized protein n=1 Tax=Phaseolus angularis TaxID=3914 RepID=A0A0L9TBI3_PHAAN|nr:hypothetical protein LR48_Vigan462s001400 [Vigna angularis]
MTVRMEKPRREGCEDENGKTRRDLEEENARDCEVTKDCGDEVVETRKMKMKKWRREGEDGNEEVENKALEARLWVLTRTRLAALRAAQAPLDGCMSGERQWLFFLVYFVLAVWFCAGMTSSSGKRIKTLGTKDKGTKRKEKEQFYSNKFRTPAHATTRASKKGVGRNLHAMNKPDHPAPPPQQPREGGRAEATEASTMDEDAEDEDDDAEAEEDFDNE